MVVIIYRACLEGPVAIDLPFLADRYLSCGTDPRKVRALLRWLQEELAAAARRADDREAVRLLRLPKILGTTEAVGDLPSLEEFRDVVDPEGEFSETDLLALYLEQYPSAPKTRQEQQGARLHTRRLDALLAIPGRRSTRPKSRFVRVVGAFGRSAAERGRVGDASTIDRRD